MNPKEIKRLARPHKKSNDEKSILYDSYFDYPSKQLEVFEKLWKENKRIKFPTFSTYVMCLGLTILYMAQTRSANTADLTNAFKKSINGTTIPPDRYILANIMLRNLANLYATEHHIHDDIEKHRGSFSIEQTRNILRKQCKLGVLVKQKGIYNKITGALDKRASHYVFSNEHIKDWLLWNMKSFGMDREDLTNYSHGKWSTLESDWLFNYIGWQGTDPDEYDERMRGFIDDAYSLF